MINLKFYEIENIISSLNKLINKELPIMTSYKLFKLIKQISKEYEFLNNKRTELINKYAERDEKNNIKYNNNNSIPIKKDMVEECNQKLNELMSIEFNVEFEPISIEVLGEISITPKDLLALDKFLKD